jgi:hypothetical protein
VDGGGSGQDRLARAALRVLLQIITLPSATRAWRLPVGKLFGQPNFFLALSRQTLPLWSRVVNAWLGLETPKAAIGLLLSGKFGKTSGWFSSRASEAEALADLLRRLTFALWVGEHNQYVGALQGMLIDRVVAGFKFGQAHAGYDAVRWVVQVQALLAMRVLAVRVAAEHLTALWPIAMAELQRVLLAPHSTRPALLLAACLLVDTVLTVLPDDFSPFGWMFVPQQAVGVASAANAVGGSLGGLGHGRGLGLSNTPSPPPEGGGGHGGTSAASAGLAAGSLHGSSIEFSADTTAPLLLSPMASGVLPLAAPAADGVPHGLHVAARPHMPPPALLAQTSVGGHASSVGIEGAARTAPEYVSLLEPLVRLAATHSGAPRPPARRIGLLRPSIDGRRRPLLGMRSLQHASDLAYFASELRGHLATSALLPRSSEVDLPLLELLLGCEFVSPREAELMLAPHWRDEDPQPPPQQHLGQQSEHPPQPSTPGHRHMSRISDISSRCTPHESL